MKACPVPAGRPDHRQAGTASLPPARPPRAPWRARRADRLPGLVRAPRTAPVCHLWRRLFPVTATAAVLADILANIAPYVLRRGRHGARPALPAPPDHAPRDAFPGGPCGRVPLAARPGSGR